MSKSNEIDVVTNESLRFITALTFTFICLLAPLSCLGDDSKRDLWAQVIADGHIAISIEQSLYEKDGLPDFYLHVSVRNLTDSPTKSSGWTSGIMAG